MKFALYSWAGAYPKIHAGKNYGGHVQHLLKRAIHQGDEGKHWFCSCDEFHIALRSQQAGSLSNIANQKPLRCEHIDKIMIEEGLETNAIQNSKAEKVLI